MGGSLLLRPRAVITFTSIAILLLALASTGYADEVVHVVQPGETLSQIAEDAGVDLAVLTRLNALGDANVLVAGQSLKLPGATGKPSTTTGVAPARRTYTVVEGDTLWSIAQQLGTTTAALMEANQLEDADRVFVGAQLIVPGGSPPTAPVPQPASSPPTPAAGPPAALTASSPSESATPLAGKRTLLASYTVQPGETLNRIASQFGVRAEAIAQASGMEDVNRLSIGRVLKVPVPGRERVVQAGETLRDIAQQEKVDLGSLIDFNELDDPGLIRIGQVVLIPAANLAAATAVPAQQGATRAAPTASLSPTPAATPSPSPPPRAAASPGPATAPAQPAPTKPKPASATAAPPPGAPSEGLAGVGLKLLGVPYVWGGSSPSGFDCSGFVWYVAQQVGKPLSRGMLGAYNSGSHPARDELKPGDLVFFQNTFAPGLSHNGIYIGNDQFVHAADEAAGVAVSSLSASYWSSRWFGATRLP